MLLAREKLNDLDHLFITVVLFLFFSSDERLSGIFGETLWFTVPQRHTPTSLSKSPCKYCFHLYGQYPSFKEGRINRLYRHVWESLKDILLTSMTRCPFQDFSGALLPLEWGLCEHKGTCWLSTTCWCHSERALRDDVRPHANDTTSCVHKLMRAPKSISWTNDHAVRARSNLCVGFSHLNLFFLYLFCCLLLFVEFFFSSDWGLRFLWREDRARQQQTNCT